MKTMYFHGVFLRYDFYGQVFFFYFMFFIFKTTMCKKRWARSSRGCFHLRCQNYALYQVLRFDNNIIMVCIPLLNISERALPVLK